MKADICVCVCLTSISSPLEHVNSVSGLTSHLSNMYTAEDLGTAWMFRGGRRQTAGGGWKNYILADGLGWHMVKEKWSSCF